MQDVFLVCFALGAIVLVVQILLDVLGFAHGTLGGDVHMGDGLDLLSVRTLSAATVVFGAIGLWLAALGVPALLSLPAGLVAGSATAVGTAYVTRQMLRLESDGSLRLENAVGQAGTVYLPIPARREGFGRVQFTLQGRTVDLRAVTDEAVIIPTGAPVIVVALLDDDIVEVTPTPQLEGIDA